MKMVEFFHSGEFEFCVESEENVITKLCFCEGITYDKKLSSLGELCKIQLDEYFCGERERFDLPTKFFGTPFQQKVWKQAESVKYGQTCSYQELAEKVGGKSLARAVAGALSKNPIVLICPCHRIIGKNGELHGFMGKENRIDIKNSLLSLEKQFSL